MDPLHLHPVFVLATQKIKLPKILNQLQLKTLFPNFFHNSFKALGIIGSIPSDYKTTEVACILNLNDLL